MNSDVVICTRDRPDDLKRCLAAIEPQLRHVQRVVVVDRSVSGDTRALVADHCRRRAWHEVIRHVPSDALGLPAQRNIGVRLSSAEIVHFFDDDLEVLPGYFEAVAAVYVRDSSHRVLGVGGNQVNVAAPTLSRARQALLPPPGRVAASGLARGVYNVKHDAEVDWLPGCCMSFRREVFSRHTFDAGLAGYANGEDIEFSYRVRQEGALVVAAAAQALHHRSSVLRLARRDVVESEVINRARRVGSGVGGYRRRSFWLSIALQLLVSAGAVASGRRSAWATLAGTFTGAVKACWRTQQGGGR